MNYSILLFSLLLFLYLTTYCNLSEWPIKVYYATLATSCSVFNAKINNLP